MHQGSALSLLLFVIVMEALSREFRVTLPWELYADDLVVIAESEDELMKRLREWKGNVENRGIRVNMNKTKVVISGEQQKVTQTAVVEALVIIQYRVLGHTSVGIGDNADLEFCYLGDMLSVDRDAKR